MGPNAVKMMHRPVAMADVEGVRRGNGALQIAMGGFHRLRQRLAPRQTGGNGGRERAAGAMGVRRLLAGRGKAQGVGLGNQQIDTGLALAMAALHQHRAGAERQQRAALREQLSGVPLVNGVRGRGLMVGVQLDRDCGELVGRAREAGLLINVTAGSVVRLLPPLVINDDELRFLVDTLAQVIRDFARDQENP